MIPIPLRVAFHTFGCKLNQYETEALASAFRAAGFSAVAGGREADVHVVNTCTVTSRADHKARALIRSVSRPDAQRPVIVTGCSAQTEAEILSGLGDNIVVVPQSEKARVLGLPVVLAAALAAGQEGLGALRTALSAPGTAAGAAAAAGPFDLVAARSSFHTRAFLKIQDGCDCRCAYCRVPAARGRSVSLPLQEVLRRAVELEERGSREIVLTGVNISSWRSEHDGLSQLIRALLERTSVARFRLSSLEPESVTGELAQAVSHPRLCPHFHVPVQSGSDPVLARMRRRYRSQDVRDGVRRLRAVKDDPFLAADIIAGFPGESPDDHRRTLELVEELGFSALHVFPFSPRPSTEAFAMTPVVPERVRRERASELGLLSRRFLAEYVQRWTGRELEVLLQSRAEDRWRGVSANYLRVEIAGVPDRSVVKGSIVRCRLRAPREPSGPLVEAEFLS